MTGRRAAAGLAVLAALAIGAVTAAGASAAVTGTTAFTCVKSETGTKVGAHCLAGTPKTGNAFKHVGFNSKTTATVTNANTAEETKAARTALLEVTLGGLKVEIRCSEVHGEGLVENRTVGEEMYLHATGSLHDTKCELLKPAPSKCSTNPTFLTKELTATSEKQGDNVKIAPTNAENAFVTIEITGAECPIKGNYPVKGSVTLAPNGATLEVTAATLTASGTLTVGGQKAGIEGALTFKGHKEGEETQPLSLTTPPYTE